MTEANPLLLTPQQAADHMGVSESTLRNWRSADTGPNYVRLGVRKIMYRKIDLDTWLGNQVVQVVKPEDES